VSALPFTNVQLAFVACYLLSLLLIGLCGMFARRENSLKDFYLAGPGIGFFVLLLTLYATQYSGNTLFGFSGRAYRDGYSWLVSVHFMIGMVITFTMFAPKLHALARSRGYITPADYIQDRFRYRPLTVLGSLVMIVGLANYLLAQLKAMGSALEGFAGDDPAGRYSAYVWGVLILALIIVVYETLGGFRAVAWTDVIQGSVLMVGFAVLIVIVLRNYGGLEAATTWLAEQTPKKTAPPDGRQAITWLSWILLVGIGGGLYPQAIQRIYSAKSATSLRRSFMVMAFLPLTTTLIVCVFGIIAAANVTTEKPDAILTIICAEIHAGSTFGAWLVVLLFAAILAALMSTADSVLLCISSMVVKDLYAPCRPNASEKELTTAGKICSWLLICVLAGGAIGVYQMSLVALLKIKFEILIQVAPAILIGLRWRKLHGRAVFGGMVVGLLVAVPWALYAAITKDTSITRPLGIHAGLWGLMANVITSIILTYAMPERTSEWMNADRVPSEDEISQTSH